MHFHKQAFLSCCIALLTASAAALAGDAAPANSGDGKQESNPTPEQWSFHAQATVVGQGDPRFRAAYSGPQSLLSGGEFRETVSTTFFMGAQLWQGAQLYFAPEFTQGTGLSHNLGMGAYPNGEAANHDSIPVANVARLYLQQVIGLGDETEPVEADEDQLAGTRPVKRITLTLGKVAAPDYFDNNTYTHDPRTQFLNFALQDTGSWDYQGDAQGYTYGFVAEYNTQNWAIRAGTFMQPRGAGGVAMDFNIAKANGTDVELEERYTIAGRKGRVRLLGFLNFEHAARYRAALENGSTDLTPFRRYTGEYGFGISVEQEITDDLGAFLRAGWNDGKTESWVYTEIDDTAALGVSLKGTQWGRAKDVVGLAGAIDGLSRDHREFLAAGGIGPIELGDGALTYAPEEIVELYYSYQLCSTTSLTADYQFANHPGYNQDRGPVSIFAARLHWQF